MRRRIGVSAGDDTLGGGVDRQRADLVDRSARRELPAMAEIPQHLAVVADRVARAARREVDRLDAAVAR